MSEQKLADLEVMWRGRTTALRLLDKARVMPGDRETLAEANAYENCADELKAALRAAGSGEPVAWSAVEMIRAERQRQIDVEGWTAQHDNEHNDGSLATAADCYYIHSLGRGTRRSNGVLFAWPWDAKWWKPEGLIRNLQKAGALYLAEQERRVRAKEGQEDVGSRLGLVVHLLQQVLDAVAAHPAPVESVRDMVAEIAFDPTNHHNALKCPYCNPKGLKLAEPAPAESETAFMNLCEALGLQATPLAYLDAADARMAVAPAESVREALALTNGDKVLYRPRMEVTVLNAPEPGGNPLDSKVYVASEEGAKFWTDASNLSALSPTPISPVPHYVEPAHSCGDRSTIEAKPQAPTPIMQAAEKAAETVAGWSDAKRDYAARVMGDKPITRNDFVRLGILQFKEHELREIVATFCKLPGIAPAAAPEPTREEIIEEVVGAFEHLRKKMRGDTTGEELAAFARVSKAIRALTKPRGEPAPSLATLRQAIIDNTTGDMFWIGEILLNELQKETGFPPAEAQASADRSVLAIETREDGIS